MNVRVLEIRVQVLVNGESQSPVLCCPVRHLRAVVGAVGTAVGDLSQQLIAGAIKLVAPEGTILELRAGLLRAIELHEVTLVIVLGPQQPRGRPSVLVWI